MKAEPRASAPKPRCAGKAKPQARTGVKKDMKVPTLPPAVKRALAANISENDPALCVEAGPSFGKAIALLTGPKAKPQPWMANFKAYPKDHSFLIQDARDGLAKLAAVPGKAGKNCLYGTGAQVAEAVQGTFALTAPTCAALKAPPLAMIHITPGGRGGLTLEPLALQRTNLF